MADIAREFVASGPAAAGGLRKFWDETKVFIWRDVIQTIRMPERT